MLSRGKVRVSTYLARLFLLTRWGIVRGPRGWSSNGLIQAVEAESAFECWFLTGERSCCGFARSDTKSWERREV